MVPKGCLARGCQWWDSWLCGEEGSRWAWGVICASVVNESPQLSVISEQPGLGARLASQARALHVFISYPG